MNDTQKSPSTRIIELRKGLFDEFKLAEDKIDRIGEFLFKIRTWAITANSSLILAVISDKLSPYTFLIGAIATSAFWRMEKQQKHLSDGYANRAIALESALDKITASLDGQINDEVIIQSIIKNLSKTQGIARSSRRKYEPQKIRLALEDRLYKISILTYIFATLTYAALAHYDFLVRLFLKS